MNMRTKRMLALAGVVGLLAAAGCSSSAPKSSIMTTDDYEYIATEIAGKIQAQLGAEGPFANRTPDSPPWVISITKVTNLTSDIMSESTKWYLMEKVASSIPFAQLAREKNVRFVIPADRLRAAKERGTVEQDTGAERQTTHLMTATFTSVTRSTDKDRTDLYYCEYSIVERAGGEILWNDKVEFKRTAHGRSWD